MEDDKKEKPQRQVIVKGYTDFTPEEIAAARKKKNAAFAFEMDCYNMRSMRGDFDSY